ncbi:MAG: phosphoribosylformylglycinamidine synthase subunit PurL [Bacteroidales bacterium]|nr:phosphoribosylformylglycinamidine synthase subunit PurL [Bacteroidales bacterium]
MGRTSNQKEVTLKTAKKLGLLPEEFEKIKEVLGRTPNFTELSLYSVMWSEHCSYKNSVYWLKTLPKEGPQMLAKAGEENAGLVDIGDGIGCAFKIESHNHPSAVEPYQGAATGVGGINRDIFTMGARPIAQLNSLRFGDIKLDRTKWLVKGIVKGIGDYGNAFGVPVVGGEVYFNNCYNTNPLVNAMSVGIVKEGNVISAISKGVGNPVYIVGSSTGKDGIHGATFASEDITENSSQDLPSVQVGDPFQEKLLLEASLEVIKTKAVVGMQDMGAAGIICSSSEMSDKGKHGMIIDLDKVPLRQKDMHPFEILLSESQERMLVIAEKGKEKKVEAVFKKWDLNCVQIGEVTGDGELKFYKEGELAAQVPATSLVLGGGAPVYQREYKKPPYYAKIKKITIDDIPEPEDLKKVAQHLTTALNLASKRWVIEQYDTMVGTKNMNTNAPSDAAIVNVKGTNKALVMTTDCNSKYVYTDPKKGTEIAVAEAARNIVCSGGKPLAITNCLNFGNPYNPEVYWQFVEAVKGMGNACRKFKTPVTGGNVSFYNQSSIKGKVEPVYPTPVIGMIGLLNNKENLMTLDFKQKGDVIFLIGECKNDINSSEYLTSYHKIKLSPIPEFDIDEELKVQKVIQNLIKEKIIKSAHDVSEGGIYITLIESAMHRKLGFDITSEGEIRTDAFLFGESQSRVIVSVSPKKESEFIDFMINSQVEFAMLGHVTKGSLRIDDESYGHIKQVKNSYNSALEKTLK